MKNEKLIAEVNVILKLLYHFSLHKLNKAGLTSEVTAARKTLREAVKSAKRITVIWRLGDGLEPLEHLVDRLVPPELHDDTGRLIIELAHGITFGDIKQSAIFFHDIDRLKERAKGQIRRRNERHRSLDLEDEKIIAVGDMKSERLIRLIQQVAASMDGGQEVLKFWKGEITFRELQETLGLTAVATLEFIQKLIRILRREIDPN